MEKQSDSNTYRRILEFVKENGIDDLHYLVKDFCEIASRPEHIIQKGVFEKRNLISELIKKSGGYNALTKFLDGFDNGFLNGIPIASKEFLEILDGIAIIEKRYNLDTAIKNATALEELKIDNVIITNKPDSYNFGDKESALSTQTCQKKVVTLPNGICILDPVKFDFITKNYSNSNIFNKMVSKLIIEEGNGTFDNPFVFYDSSFHFDTYFSSEVEWILRVHNDYPDNLNKRKIVLSAFDVDLSRLPNKEEIESCEMTQEMRDARNMALVKGIKRNTFTGSYKYRG